MSDHRTTDGRGRKRPFDGGSEGGAKDSVYRFNVLVNGMTVRVKVTDRTSMAVEDFIRLVRAEYSRQVKDKSEAKRPLNWNDGRLFLEDINENKFKNNINFSDFMPHKCHILRLHDGRPQVTDAYENFWDLTPDIDLLRELPEEYTFETALAELIDNSLQAVWSNAKNERKLISVDIKEGKISIFDTGPGMDNSEENSLAKWGKMGASLNRLSKAGAIGGKPPYLMPSFGMFGYGGLVASMHLGRHAMISAKTKQVKKVFVLHFNRDSLLNRSADESSWKTKGATRDPSNDEISKSQHGSFTKVEISNLKMKTLNIFKLQCMLKDIYFPYIQCDDENNARKTTIPVEFKVNGVNLAEIEGGEVSITNLHSCNGPHFVFQLCFFVKHDNDWSKGHQGKMASEEANAQLKCVYFPIIKGKETSEMILDKLEAEGCGFNGKNKTFRRVSIRRLGRLLPDAHWPCLPFMDFKQKKGDKSQLLKRCSLRVMCFIDTDAGFNPTTSKTDLVNHNHKTAALRNFGSKMLEKEKDVDIRIYRDGKLLTQSQLEKEYQDWILNMHFRYDEEIESGVDNPVLVVGPKNKKALGILADVVRVHQIFKRKGAYWKRGQKVKVLKGACAGVHKNNIYATIEYFLIEGFEGDTGGDAWIICRPLNIGAENGCALVVNNGNASLDIHESLSLPIHVIDSGKCEAIERHEWDIQLDKQQQKTPSTIDLLCDQHCQELDLDWTLTNITNLEAGKEFPREIVAVVRPSNYSPRSAFKNLDQKYIFRAISDMSLQVKFQSDGKDDQTEQHIFSMLATPSSCKGIDGLYIFRPGHKAPDIFQRCGVYNFLFSLIDSSCKSYEKTIVVTASSEISKWRILGDNQSQPLRVNVGSSLLLIRIGCFDAFGNRIPFTSIPKVIFKLDTSNSINASVDQGKISCSSDKLALEIKGVVIKSNELDKIRPGYDSTLLICSVKGTVLLSIPCQVTPGSLHHVTVHTPIEEKQLHPGFIVKELVLEMFDPYGNHVMRGSEIELNVDGFRIINKLGLRFKVDDDGSIDLGGFLQVTASFGSRASFYVLSEDEVFLKQEFLIDKRETSMASEVHFLQAADMECDHIQSPLLDAKALLFQDSPLHNHEGKQTSSIGDAEDVANQISFIEDDESARQQIESPLSDKKALLVQDASSLENHVGDVMPFIADFDRQLWTAIHRLAEQIGSYEEELKGMNNHKAEIQLLMSQLEASLEPELSENVNNIFSKEEMMEQIERGMHTVAAILCRLSKETSYQEPEKYFMEDIVGLVALLGTVDDNKLSRVLAEFLGDDQMLAVVCKSYEAGRAIEKYMDIGEVDNRESAAFGKPIYGRFLVICLEDIRPYKGKIVDNDQQRKLSLPAPTLPSGKVPTGFMGYAVNFINVDAEHMETGTGYSLRETLFFCLFGELQIYDTKEHMINARACIKHGAVSCDGGIIREKGIISLGKGNPEVHFPVSASDDDGSHISARIVETKRRLKEKEAELQVTKERIEKVARKLERAKRKFEKKSKNYKFFMDSLMISRINVEREERSPR